MRIRIARRDVVPAESSCGLVHRCRHLDSRFDRELDKPHKVVSPWTTPQPVEKSLDAQLGSLLGREARPVMEASASLDARALARPVGLFAPAAELLAVHRTPIHDAAIIVLAPA